MEANLQAVVDSGVLPQRGSTSYAHIVRAPDGRRIPPMGVDNKPTKEGVVYYRLLGVPPPTLYNYHQPLINDRWVEGYDGRRIKVRERNEDGSWRILAKGVGYFRYNRVEYLAQVPYVLARRDSITRGDYMPMQIDFSGADNQGPPVRDEASGSVIREVVGQIRQAQFRGRPLHASREITTEEARQSTLAQLRLRDTVVIEEAAYHILGIDSDVLYLWDENRPLQIDQRRTNFWDDAPPTTEAILGRPLQSWALPDGMWRPFDLHPDTFQRWDHGCAVQMLYQSFTKRPSGAQQRRGVSASSPHLTVAEIQSELDECFVILGYANEVHPFTRGWREDGVPAAMVLRFCEMQAAKSRPLKCHVFHAGLKIAEYVPDAADRNTPSVSFAVFGEHAYHYMGAAKVVSAKRGCGAQEACDEFTQRSVRKIFEHDWPPFREWRSETDFATDLEDDFRALGAKRRKTEAGRESVVYWTTDVEAALADALRAQTRLAGTERCFGIHRGYGASPDELTKLTLTTRDNSNIVVRQVGERALADSHFPLPILLDDLATRLDVPGFVYRGASYAGFGEQLRLALARARTDVSASARRAVLERQGDACALCGERGALEMDHVRAVADGGGSDADNLQAVCQTCHRERSRSQRLATFACGFYSELSTDVLEAIVDAPKPQQLVFGDGARGCLELDVKLCRRWAIEKADVPLPVACVLDCVVPYRSDGPRPDLVYLDAGPPDTDAANFAAYQGPRWYTWELARWVLDTGVRARDHAVEELHCVASFTASSHVHPDRLRASYAEMSAAMERALADRTLEGNLITREGGEECYQRWSAHADEVKGAFFKKIFLAMQGAWLTQHHYAWTCTETPCADDVRGRVARFRDLEDSRGTCRYMVCSETFTNRTMYLFGLYALSREHLLVCRAMRLTRNVPGVTFHGVVGDAVLLKAGERARRIVQGRVLGTRRADGSLFFRIKAKERDAPRCEPLARHTESHASAWRTRVDAEDVRRFGPSELGSWLHHARFL